MKHPRLAKKTSLRVPPSFGVDPSAVIARPTKWAEAISASGQAPQSQNLDCFVVPPQAAGLLAMTVLLGIFSFILTFGFLLLFPSKGLEALLQTNRIVLISEGTEKDSGQGTLTFPAGGVDFSQMSYLSFNLTKGRGLEEDKIFVELRGKEGNYRVKASPFHRRAAPFGEKIVIPLSEWRQVRRWDRILEIAVGFEGTSENLKQELPVRNLLLGSNYPEGFKGREIPMQNRVSSFKIGGRVASPEMKLKGNPSSLTLTLTFVDPYLEEIRFEESRDEGYTWSGIRSFFDHSNGGTYTTRWEPARGSPLKKGVLVRAVGMNLWGGESHLAGPYRLHLD